MGTRGLLGVYVEGDMPKAVYNHYDSYPSGLGLDTIKFTRGLDNADKRQELAAKVAALTTIDENEVPTPEQAADLEARGFSPQKVSSGDDWYAWLRDAQGGLAKYIDAGYMPDSASFGNDSLFCEWGYIINLAENTLEVYKGFQRAPHEGGFWASYDPTSEENTSPWRTDAYYGIKRIAVYDLDNLPTDAEFLSLESPEDEED